MNKYRFSVCCIVFAILLAQCKKEFHVPDTRSFHIGFTPHPYAYHDLATAETYQFTVQHSDIISHHLDWGVPWEEALNNQPYPKTAEQDINTRLQKTPKSLKIFLSLNPLDGDRRTPASYWGEPPSQEIANKWKQMKFSDSLFIAAYLNYCRQMIARFKPHYFAYVIEANLDFKPEDKELADLLMFCATVYPTLKNEYPDLPVMVTLVNAGLGKPTDEVQKVAVKFIPYTDYVAVSTYPYMLGVPYVSNANPDKLPSDWLSAMRALAPQKPFAVSETGFIAEDFEIPGILLHKSNPEWQMNYVQMLFEECQNLNAQFAIWFVPQDMDKGTEMASALGMDKASPFGFYAWKDTGLRDGDFKPRPSLRIWDKWLSKPKPL